MKRCPRNFPRTNDSDGIPIEWVRLLDQRTSTSGCNLLVAFFSCIRNRQRLIYEVVLAQWIGTPSGLDTGPVWIFSVSKHEGRSCDRDVMWSEKHWERENDIPAPRQTINNVILEFILIEEYSNWRNRPIYWWYFPRVREATGALIYLRSFFTSLYIAFSSWGRTRLTSNGVTFDCNLRPFSKKKERW